MLESANPAWTRSVHLDAPGQRHGQQPISGTADPGVVKKDKSSRGSVGTTKTRLGPQRVRMSSGERPIGATKGKESETEALCQTPLRTPALSFVKQRKASGGSGASTSHLSIPVMPRSSFGTNSPCAPPNKLKPWPRANPPAPRPPPNNLSPLGSFNTFATTTCKQVTQETLDTVAPYGNQPAFMEHAPAYLCCQHRLSLVTIGTSA